MFIPYLILSIDFVVVRSRKKEEEKKRKEKRGFGFNLLVPCFVLLYTFTFSPVFCVLGRMGWVGGVGWWKGASMFKLSNFCTYMDYLYRMPKWSHSRFYEIKLLINISIY